MNYGLTRSIITCNRIDVVWRVRSCIGGSEHLYARPSEPNHDQSSDESKLSVILKPYSSQRSTISPLDPISNYKETRNGT